MTRLLGVDGCRGGWCAAPIEANGTRLRLLEPVIYRSFEEVLASDAELICIDMPIGLLDRPGQRASDLEARRLLGRRRAAVFPPPSRGALGARSYKDACAINLQITGRRISLQAYNIAAKIREVDESMKPVYQNRVLEAHPELCFAAVNQGRPLADSKKKQVGQSARWALLRTVLPELPPERRLPPSLRPTWPHRAPPGVTRGAPIAATCGLDDYMDALACAWTAACVVRGIAARVPSVAEKDESGLRMEIWYPRTSAR